MDPVKPIRLDRFEILEPIGEGVSARVYKARDTATDSLVAIKILKPHLQTDPLSLERLRRELLITRSLQHPQIVPIYDLVRRDDETYLVMEYVEGSNLKDFIVLHAPIPIDTVLSVLTQVLKILAVCHRCNVIHRDLKPQNIMVTADQVVRLLDFGIAKMVSLSDLTQTGTAIGSPEYMAPELFARNFHDPRTDLYALGIIAFELVAGVAPFRADSLATLYHQHANAPVPALSAYRADVPEWLQQLIARLLAKAAYARYQSADEALADIAQERVLAREAPSLRTIECVSCGARTLFDLPVCVHCGHRGAAAGAPGDYDVLCAQDVDDGRLNSFLEAVMGLQQPPRRGRRSLLLSGVDGFTAELLKGAARRHDLLLSVRPHPATTELRKAIPLAIFALLIGCFWQSVAGVLAAYGREDGPQFGLLESPSLGLAITLGPLALLLTVGWVCLRRFRAVEVVPVIPAWRSPHGSSAHGLQWVERLLPSLSPERSDALKGCVAQLIEQYLKLSRFGRGLGGVLDVTLQQLVDLSARLACVISDIDRALSVPRFADLARRSAALDRVEAPSRDGRPEGLRGALGAELEAYIAAEERQANLANRLAQVQALFNGLVGRSLVLRAAPAPELHEQLADTVRQLETDVRLSREAQADLARLA